MKPGRENLLELAYRESQRRAAMVAAFSKEEMTVVSAICNRVSRMLGLNDRQGLCQDLEIVQQVSPLNLEALAGATDRVFLEELTHMLDSINRSERSIAPDFDSRFKREKIPETAC
ncbi:MAG: hypothetical protein AAF671_09405 [Pseudomonadota bacterium]